MERPSANAGIEWKMKINRLKNSRLAFCLFVVVAGCGPSDEEIEQKRKAQYEKDVLTVTAQCDALGFKRNTNDFLVCAQQMYNILVLDRRAMRAERQQAITNGFRGIQQTGQALQGGGYSPSSVGTMGTTLNCRPQPFPGQLYCY